MKARAPQVSVVIGTDLGALLEDAAAGCSVAAVRTLDPHWIDIAMRLRQVAQDLERTP